MKGFLAAILIGVSLAAPDRGFAQQRDYGDQRGISDREADDLGEWCDNVLKALAKAEREASDWQRQGNMKEVFGSLRRGLVRANSKGQHATGLMTKMALERGIRNLKDLESVLGNTGRAYRTLTYYTSKYYDFVRRVVSDLDLPLYIPWQRCGRCRNSDYDQLERKYVQFVGESIRAATQGLVMNIDGHPVVAGSARALLKTMKAAAGDAAEDLEDSLSRYRYSCTIEDLEQIACDIDPDASDKRFQLVRFWEPLDEIGEMLIGHRECTGGHNYSSDHDHKDHHHDRDHGHRRRDHDRNHGHHRDHDHRNDDRSSPGNPGNIR